VKGIKNGWDGFEYEIDTESDNPYEANLLKLDCSKANTLLRWKPIWDFERAIDVTMRWYKEYFENKKIHSLKDLEEYINHAKMKNIEWTDKFIPGVSS
jgi:CDP-glucose 4,6-dehydratase